MEEKEGGGEVRVSGREESGEVTVRKGEVRATWKREGRVRVPGMPVYRAALVNGCPPWGKSDGAPLKFGCWGWS